MQDQLFICIRAFRVVIRDMIEIEKEMLVVQIASPELKELARAGPELARSWKTCSIPLPV